MSTDNSRLPNLVSLYQRGLLVPFIGSGMSRPACPGWLDMLIVLADTAGMAEAAAQLKDEKEAVVTRGKTLDTGMLYRVADAVIHKMHALPHEKKANCYRAAIKGWPGDGRADIPDNMRALTDGLHWPLVLTTNYDDLYWAACNERPRDDTQGNKEHLPRIRGRGLADCHDVLRSLDRFSSPICWALQGFLGGQRNRPSEVVRSAERLRQLESQIVVGHQQYQQAINGDPHFRRAFAEVFRRRSFLFLGSGILEDYIINLFSEIVYNHGPSAYPHIALLPESEEQRSRFLETRLGITPVFWKYPSEIGDLLHTLKAAMIPSWDVTGLPTNVTVRSAQVYTVAPKDIQVSIRLRKIPTALTPIEAVAVSAGRNRNRPKLGDFGVNYLAQTNRRNSAMLWLARDRDDNAFVYQYQEDGLFAIAARRPQGGDDYRDLGVIPEAVCVALKEIEKRGFTKVYMGSVASGYSARNLWNPIHPFAQTLRGIRRFALAGMGTLKDIEVCVVTPQIWAALSADRLPVQEMLAAEFFPFSVELHRSDGHVETYNLMIQDGTKVEEVLQKCGLDRGDWQYRLRPHPTDNIADPVKSDQIVTATMTLIISPK